jgi:Ca2+-binding RTX toxin-like protein
LLSLSGWLLTSSLASFSAANVAWAIDDNDDDDNEPTQANEIPEKEPCAKCENSKNVIRGPGPIIVGTNQQDFIVAIPSDNGNPVNMIFGKDKPDIIFGDADVDTVYSGAGGDTIQGGPGNDQIFGEGGDDQLYGGSDDDLIVGGEGNNHLFGDIGNDVLEGGENSGANYFDCGDGLDTIIDFNLAKGDITGGNCEIF